MKSKKFFKAIISFCLIIFLCFSACAKKNNEKKDEPSVKNEYYAKSLDLSGKIFDDFWLEKAKRFMAYVPEYISGNLDTDKSGTSALWGFGAALTMTGTMAKLDSKYGVIKNRAQILAEGLEQYRYPRKGYIYSATVGLSEPYYDDNAWVALGMFDLGEAYGDDKYYTVAKGITDYVLSGESENGGIFWKESVSSRNTCSCGPAIVSALKQYKRSGDVKYFDAAKRIYRWTRDTLCDPSDYVYWDNATYNENTGKEEVQTAKFTYNSGTMIWAGVLLYELTNEQKYLSEAKQTAEGAYGYFCSRTPKGIEYYPSTPWFNLYLLQGYYALYKVDGNDAYMESFKANLDLAWQKGRDENGYVMPNWGAGTVLDEYKYVSLLQETATAECYAIIGDYQLKKS